MTPRRVDPINTPGRSAPNAHQQTLSSPKDSVRAQLWLSLDGSEQRSAPPPPWGILPMMAGGGYQNVTSQRWESMYSAGQNVRSGFAVTSYGKTRTNSLANPIIHRAELFHLPNNLGMFPQTFMYVKRTFQGPHPVGHINTKYFCIF